MSRTHQPVVAAGGVVVRAGPAGIVQVLILYRRGEWDLPKGKLDEGETVAECALREVEEETGLAGLRLGPHLTTTMHRYEDAYGSWDKTTHWYLMKVDGDGGKLTPQTEEQIESLEWVGIEEALHRVRYEGLKVVLGLDAVRNLASINNK